MARKLAVFSSLVITLILMSGCATQRPVIYQADNFSGKAVRKGRTAFLLPTEVDLTAEVQNFIIAFDGDPSQGEKFILGHLSQYLSSDATANELNVGMHPRQGMRLTNLAEFVDYSDVMNSITATVDKYGITQVEVNDPERLDSLLNEAGFDYLILCLDLKVAPHDVTEDSVWGAGLTGSRGAEVTALGGQVIIWDRENKSIIWNGFVKGREPLGRSFSKRNVTRLTGDFVYEMGNVLR